MDETTVTLDMDINVRYFSYNYDEKADRLFIVSGDSAFLDEGDSYVITEIVMSGEFAVKQYAMKNTAGDTIRAAVRRYDTWGMDGFVYFQNYGNYSSFHIYRQEIGNPSNVTMFPENSEVNECYPMFAYEGKMVFEYSAASVSSSNMQIVDTASFTMKYPESGVLMGIASSCQYVPVIGVPMTYYISSGNNSSCFGIRTDYLATVNNLDVAVVKTADKTMKVTYTLQEK